ncbi:MAG: HU family DNA-binding protein [Bacteroidales bacterium]
MNNKEFEKKLTDTLPFKTDVVGVLNKEWLAILEKELSQDNSVQINSFGTFELKKKTERITKHPSTKKRILIPPKLALVFSPSKFIKSAIKKITPHE